MCVNISVYGYTHAHTLLFQFQYRTGGLKKCYKYKVNLQTSEAVAVSGKEKEDLRQVWAVTLGLCGLSGAEQRRAKGPAVFVMLAVKVQHALFSSSVDRTRVPGVILWFFAQVCRDCKWCQLHSVTARKSILILGILY